MKVLKYKCFDFLKALEIIDFELKEDTNSMLFYYRGNIKSLSWGGIYYYFSKRYRNT